MNKRSLTQHAALAAIVFISASCSTSAEPTSDDSERPAPEDAIMFNFDADDTGAIAAGFSEGLTGGGGPGQWRVEEALDARSGGKVLAQRSAASGGLVFRYQDTGNYYVVRANSLEGNVVAYKTENGKRSNIGVKGRGNAYGVEIDVPHQQWNSLRVIIKGNLFEIFLNGRKLFEVEDTTFPEAGRVGLWTKADAVTQFDDLRVKSLDE